MRVLKGGKDKPSKVEQLLFEKFGNMSDARIEDDHADILVPKENIIESSKAVMWLGNFIDALDKENKETGNADKQNAIDSLKGVYLVFRDCSLMAKYFHQFRETQLTKNFRGLDLVYRFTIDPKDKKTLRFEIGSMKPVETDKDKEPPYDDDF